MKLRTTGQKIMNFGTSLGHKINKGVRSLGQKVYDNRYKILAGVGAMGAAAAMGVAQNMAGPSTASVGSGPTTADRGVQAVPPSRALRQRGAFKIPNPSNVILNQTRDLESKFGLRPGYNYN